MARGVLKTFIYVVVIIIIIYMARILVERYVIESNIFPSNIKEIYREYVVIIDIILITLVGVLSIQMLSTATLRAFRNLGKEAYTIRNIVVLIGFIILTIVILGRLGVSPEVVWASATFSGLIIGFSLGPLLGNFFSGLMILASGYVRPGRYVKISGVAPINLLASPSYKFFSRDHALPVIKGVVLEIGLLYTKIISSDGELVKISNTSLLNNGVVIEEYEETKTVQVRYEFPISCNPDLVLQKINESLSKNFGEKSFRIYLEEQSDKNYYIVLAVSEAPADKGVREYRSSILKEFIKIHRDLVENNICK